MKETLFISAIIPTLNAHFYLESLLARLKKQSINCKIVLIDSSSCDDTVIISKKYGDKVLIIPKDDFNHGKTRNFGIQETSGDITVLLTQDAIPADDYCLENLLKPLDDPKIVASFGRQLPKLDASPTEKFTRLFNYPDKPMIKGIDDLPRFGIKTFFLAMPARQ